MRPAALAARGAGSGRASRVALLPRGDSRATLPASASVVSVAAMLAVVVSMVSAIWAVAEPAVASATTFSKPPPVTELIVTVRLEGSV